MLRRLAVLFCFLGCLPLQAAISGYVMTTDGQPLAGAKVEVFALETLDAAGVRLLSATPERIALKTAVSDAKGKFTLESPKDVVMQLRVSAPGFAPESMRIEHDEEIAAIALSPAETKTGRITANGKPVAGAKVIWSGAGEAMATTDEQGRYTAPDPAKWASNVTIVHPDYALTEDSMQRRFAQTPSIDQKIDAGVAVKGKVVGEDGKTPVAGASIWINGWPIAKTANDGTFAIAHAPSKWQLIVAKNGGLVGTRARAASASDITIKLAKSATVSGTIRDMKTQAPLAGADVRLRTQTRFDATEAANAFTDAKGNFTLSGVVPGSYELTASRPGYRISPTSVSLAANEKTTKSIVATQLARVSGVVVDEEKRGVAAARINSLIAGRGDEGFMRGAGGLLIGTGGGNIVSAPDGTFVARVPAETDIQVHAVKKGFPVAKTSTMRFSPGERKSGIVLTIPSGVAISGRVVDKNGKPVSGVSVATTEATGSSPMMIRRMVGGFNRVRNDDLVKTANDGTFGMRVKEGTYDFAFKHEGFATKVARAVHVTTTAKPIEVTLEPGAEITGRVTRNGAGVEGVRIMAISEASNANTETAADGSFRLTDLTPGQMMLNAMKEDEFIQQIRPVTVPASDIVIEIPAGGRITGHVVDKTTKQPVTAFEAGISTPRGGGGMMIMLPPALKQFTSEDGSFVLENVPPGQTQVVVNAAGYTSARLPNVNVEEGKTIADLEVAMDKGVRVVGHVTGPDGSALAGVSARVDTMSSGRMMRVGPMQGQSAVTDANGDYSIESVESGDTTIVFTRSGYLTTQKSATLSGTESRVDAQLSTGTRVTGMVVTDTGAPVADASVNALSSTNAGFNNPGTTTDANGGFSFEGLAPGHYNFGAYKQGLASGESKDIDITSGAPVRIVMKTGGVIYGHVSGLTTDELQQAMVSASGTSGGGSTAPVDSSGSYRMEGAPTGTVRVTARTGGMGFAGGGKTSPIQSVQLDAGGSIQVDIAFKSDTVIRGQVSRNGRPIEGAMISFFPKDATAQTTTRVTSDSNGRYEASGLDDATYTVTVVDVQRSAPYNTTYQVRGSGNFDIDMKAAALRGRVMDSDGNALADAAVDVRETDNGGARFARMVSTDVSGNFMLDNVPSGTYSVSATKDGYGTRVVDTTVNDSGGDVQISLTKNVGVTLRVVDARDNRSLNAQVHVTNAQGATVYDSPFFGGGSTDAIKLPLEAGSYSAVVSAMGYASQSISLNSPSSLTIGMTPGGTITIQSKGSGLRRARLLGADGKEYSRNRFGPAIFTIDPSPGVTILNNIAPGVYTLQILGDGNEVTAATPVTVLDGQQASVSI